MLPVFCYDILLEKFQLYGMHETAVKWFSSYLKDIHQHTYASGTLSIVVKLFLVCPKVQYSGQHCFWYIFVLSECIADIFTDDFTISAHNKNIDQVASTLSNELQQVNK